MSGTIARRLAAAIPSLFGVVIVTFLLTRALPGDPAAFFAGPSATRGVDRADRESWDWTRRCRRSSSATWRVWCTAISASR